MSVSLHRSGFRVQSVFGLHGTDENDLSAAFAFGISRSTALLHTVLEDVAPECSDLCETASVHIQTARSSAGITDIEIRFGDEAIVVLEAKKGPEYPTQAQLGKYVAGCQACGFGKVKVVALTSREPVRGGTPSDWVKIGVPVRVRSVLGARAGPRSRPCGKIADDEEFAVRIAYISGGVYGARTYILQSRLFGRARRWEPEWLGDELD